MTIREAVSFSDDGFVVQRSQNVASIVNYAKARHNEGFHGPSKDFKLMAVIPVLVVESYCTVNQITLRQFNSNPEHIRRIVNDPAFADLRVAPGKM